VSNLSGKCRHICPLNRPLVGPSVAPQSDPTFIGKMHFPISRELETPNQLDGVCVVISDPTDFRTQPIGVRVY
jgi:hypothetical protein